MYRPKVHLWKKEKEKKPTNNYLQQVTSLPTT